MTVCRQLNYSRKTVRYSDYLERLVLDGEADGRNWSLVEREWLRDAKWHGGRFQRFLRIDLSEYYYQYGSLFTKKRYTCEQINSMLRFSVTGLGRVQVSVCNQSPGIWENGFNPNLWLNVRVQTYSGGEDRLRSIVETGVDLESPSDFAKVVENAVKGAAPFIEELERVGPPATPYADSFFFREAPPPRKPVGLFTV